MRRRMASSSYFDEEEPSEPFHCTICMTELPRWPADACTLQPCGHHFHLECATRWMDRESSCPNCKTGVTTIAKVSGRSKRRRSEIAVEPKRQSVAEQDMELPDAETQLEAPPSEGYQRDGFVVGDDDVEFYSSEEERARVVRPRRGRAAAARANALIEEERARAEALLRRSGRLGRLRRHAQADSQPPSDSDSDDEAQIALPLPPLARGRLRRNIAPETQSQEAPAPESSPDDDDWDESQGEADAAPPSQSQDESWDDDEEEAAASPAPRSPSPRTSRRRAVAVAAAATAPPRQQQCARSAVGRVQPVGGRRCFWSMTTPPGCA